MKMLYVVYYFVFSQITFFCISLYIQRKYINFILFLKCFRIWSFLITLIWCTNKFLSYLYLIFVIKLHTTFLEFIENCKNFKKIYQMYSFWENVIYVNFSFNRPAESIRDKCILNWTVKFIYIVRIKRYTL